MDTRQALSRVVGAVREGRVPDADIHERADRIRDELSRRVMPELPAIASPAAIADLEAELAAPLPAVLRRAYLEVANGGFGPGGGLMALEASMRCYRELRVSPQGPRHEPWLETLLPLVDEDPGCVCIDLSTGRIVRSDPEEMADRQNGRTWKRSFIEIEPHAEAWLEKWLSTPTFEERMAVRMAKSNLVRGVPGSSPHRRDDTRGAEGDGSPGSGLGARRLGRDRPRRRRSQRAKRNRGLVETFAT